MAFKQFVASDRRDARCVRENSDPQNIQKEFIQLDTKSIRNKFHVPEIRALALGRFWSPAARSMAMHGTLQDGKCPHCPEIGTLRQILWDCLQNPPSSVPVSVLGWRMGWVTQPYWHNHVCKTIRFFWDLRHDQSTENHPRDDGIG